MKKVIKTVSKGIVQITIADERWYIMQDKDLNNIYVPSVTWICSHYPKGIQFYKWLANTGWNESEAIKNAAGNKGSKVHLAIADLIKWKAVKMDDNYPNASDVMEELTLQEYEAILSFANWCNDVNPEFIESEKVIFNLLQGYAGTIDILCKINGENWLIDVKTSANIWAEYELQVSAYGHALNDMPKLGILQVGYARNKKKYKFTEIQDKFDLFLAAKQIWSNECANVQPKKVDYPESIQLKQKESA